jgi:hypothetical protein
MKFSVLLINALYVGSTVSLNEVSECDEFEEFVDDPLGFIGHLQAEAIEYKVVLSPSPASIKSWDDQIVISRVNSDDINSIGKSIIEQSEDAELPSIEFKSTLFLDVKRQWNDPSAQPVDLKSTIICHSSMKNICAFLNESGGSLIIGLDDDGNVFGLENEFEITCPNDQTIDGWLKQFRDAVMSFFHEPKEVLHHLNIEVGKVNESFVVRVRVTGRKKMSVCKCKKKSEWSVYTKNGTSVDLVEVTEMEGYIRNRLDRI